MLSIYKLCTKKNEEEDIDVFSSLVVETPYYFLNSMYKRTLFTFFAE